MKPDYVNSVAESMPTDLFSWLHDPYPYLITMKWAYILLWCYVKWYSRLQRCSSKYQSNLKMEAVCLSETLASITNLHGVKTQRNIVFRYQNSVLLLNELVSLFWCIITFFPNSLSYSDCPYPRRCISSLNTLTYFSMNPGHPHLPQNTLK
jgi:hypothetical protein